MTAAITYAAWITLGVLSPAIVLFIYQSLYTPSGVERSQHVSKEQSRHSD